MHICLLRIRLSNSVRQLGQWEYPNLQMVKCMKHLREQFSSNIIQKELEHSVGRIGCLQEASLWHNVKLTERLKIITDITFTNRPWYCGTNFKDHKSHHSTCSLGHKFLLHPEHNYVSLLDLIKYTQNTDQIRMEVTRITGIFID